MWLRNVLLCLVLGLVLLPLFIRREPQPAPAADDPDLLRNIMRQHAAAIDAIESLYVEFSWRADSIEQEYQVSRDKVLPGGRRTVEGFSKSWQRDGLYHQDLTQRTIWHSTSEEKTERTIAILNDSYFLRYLGEHGILTRYHFDDPASIYEPAATHAAAYPYSNLLDFGYRVRGSTLDAIYRSAVEQHPGYFEWSARTLAGGEEGAFTITNTADVKGQPYLRQEFVINSKQGFLIRDYAAYDRDGNTVATMQCRFREVTHGIWMPVHVSTFRSDRNHRMEIEVHDVRVNQPMDKNVFTREGMEIDPSTITNITEYSPEDARIR